LGESVIKGGRAEEIVRTLAHEGGLRHSKEGSEVVKKERAKLRACRC
jgi:hypothetical protein